MSDPRWGDDPRDIDNDRCDRSSRDRDEHDGAPDLSRAPSSRDDAEPDPRDREDERWADRSGDPRDRDPRDVFMRELNLPRGREREIVYDARDREYTLRGSETRTLSTVGAFRVVSARDLRDHTGQPADPRRGDLRRLREQGLVDTVRQDGRRDVAVVLTDRRRDLLDHHRDGDSDARDGVRIVHWRASPRADSYPQARRDRHRSRRSRPSWRRATAVSDDDQERPACDHTSASRERGGHFPTSNPAATPTPRWTVPFWKVMS
jgi:hypothetical protein